jgi:hypothetical protein
MKYEINGKNSPNIMVEADCIQFLTRVPLAGYVNNYNDDVIGVFFTEPIDLVFRRNENPATVWVNCILPDKDYTIIYKREKVDSVQ